MNQLTNGYWHHRDHRGTGVLLMFKEERVAGLLFTLGRSGQQIVTTFTSQLTNDDIIDLYYFAREGWPGDNNTPAGEDVDAEKVGTISISNIGDDKIHVEVALESRIVGGLHPSPPLPPHHLCKFSLDMDRLF